MYDNEFFVVDMASCQSTGEIVNSLSLALETLNHSGKKIVLKLNDSHLNQSQLLSIQSLVTSYGCILDTIETINKDTASVAENMNITVQVPIEKRIEEKIEKTLSSDPPEELPKKEFEPFSINVNDDKKDIIALKDVNGLHFEADLNSIKEQRENIDIQSDLKGAGIDPDGDFREIENEVISRYQKSNDIIEHFEEPTNQNDYLKSNTIIPPLRTIEEEQFENAEKNSISVYKKAYDNNESTQDTWEEVDFYETPTTDPVVTDSKETTYINQTLRSGQILEAEGNVVIIGDCHPGSEVRAVGDITVWGVLSGIAHAGYKGNTNARVRALKMNAVQLRIANCYSRRPDGTNIPYIIKSSIFTPEEARIVDNEIVLFKINQN